MRVQETHLCLCLVNLVHCVAALDVVHETEVLVGLGDGDDVWVITNAKKQSEQEMRMCQNTGRGERHMASHCEQSSSFVSERWQLRFFEWVVVLVFDSPMKPAG